MVLHVATVHTGTGIWHAYGSCGTYYTQEEETKNKNISFLVFTSIFSSHFWRLPLPLIFVFVFLFKSYPSGRIHYPPVSPVQELLGYNMSLYPTTKPFYPKLKCIMFLCWLPYYHISILLLTGSFFNLNTVLWKFIIVNL